MDNCVVVYQVGCLVVIQLECNEVVGPNAKLDACGNVADAW